MKVRLKKSLLIATLLVTPSLAGKARGQDVNSPAFTMGPRYIRMPADYFVLIRKGNQVAALKLTNIQEPDISSGRSTYESYFQGDGSGSLHKANVLKRSGEIIVGPMRGVSHTLSWASGQRKLYVGKWWFFCLSSNLINMSIHGEEKSTGYEFAPTSARTLAELDASDERLQWFLYDANASRNVPVEGLPK